MILRRVDSAWCDPLELRAGSRLGVSGLVTAVRQGTVSVVNNLGSGLLENPALLPFLPALSRHLLGEPLRMPSVETWWLRRRRLAQPRARPPRLAGDPADQPRCRPQRARLGSALSAAQRGTVVAQIRQAPHRFVGQEVLRLSSAPTSEHDRLVRRNVMLRSFAVRHGGSYTAMPGGLDRTNGPAIEGDVLVTPTGGGVAKEVWVLSSDPVAAVPVAQPGRRGDSGAERPETAAARAAVGRVLVDGAGAAGAQRPVLDGALLRARRGPAPAGAGHPLAGSRERPRAGPRQVQRIDSGLRSLPHATATARPLRVLADVRENLRGADLALLVGVQDGRRVALAEFLAGLQAQLAALSDAIQEQYLRLPQAPQPLWRTSNGQGGLS